MRDNYEEKVIIGNISTYYCEQCKHHDAEIEEGIPCIFSDAEILDNLSVASSWFVCGCFEESNN